MFLLVSFHPDADLTVRGNEDAFLREEKSESVSPPLSSEEAARVEDDDELIESRENRKKGVREDVEIHHEETKPWRCKCRISCTCACWYAILLSLPFWSVQLSRGISSGLLDTVLPLLEENVHNHPSFAMIFVSRSVGGVLGALVAGVACDLVLSCSRRIFCRKIVPVSTVSKMEDDAILEGAVDDVNRKILVGDDETDILVGAEEIPVPRSCCARFQSFLLRKLISLQSLQSLTLLVHAFLVFTYPWVHNVYILIVLQFFVAFTLAATEVGAITAVAWIWGSGLSAPVQLFHFLFGAGNLGMSAGVGAITGSAMNPLLVSCSVGVGVMLLPILLALVIPPAIQRPKVESKEEGEKEFGKEEQTGEVRTETGGGGGRRSHVKKKERSGAMMYLLWVVVAVFGVLYSGAELTLRGLGVSYMVSRNLDSESNASYLSSLFYVAYTSGRGLAVITSRFIPLPVLVLFNLIACVVCSIPLCLRPDGFPSSSCLPFQIFADVWTFRVFYILLGFFTSTINGSNYAIPKKMFNFKVTGAVTAIVILGNSIGGAIPSLVKYLMTVNTSVYAYSLCLLYSCSIVLFLIELVAAVGIKRCHDRIRENKTVVPVSDEVAELKKIVIINDEKKMSASGCIVSL